MSLALELARDPSQSDVEGHAGGQLFKREATPAEVDVNKEEEASASYSSD